MSEWFPPVTRLHCPLCEWTVDDPGPGIQSIPGHEAVFPNALARQHARVVEAVLEAHMGKHPLAEWAAEVARLRGLVPSEAPDLTAVPWRTGRSHGANIWARTGGDDWKADTPVGRMDSPELAEAACAAHNAALLRRKAEEAP